MTTKQISVQRFSITSSKPFGDVVASLEAAVGHPNMAAFRNEVASAKTYPDLEKVVERATGTSAFMEFARYDLGEIVRKRNGERAPKSVRFVVGNPVTMEKMVRHVPDAGSYAPVTILVDERPDGVHLSYDKMASFLATYGNAEALKVAQDLDSRIEAIITAAAR